MAKQNNVPIYPFYLGGLFGSRFSKTVASDKIKRKITLVFGDKFEQISADEAKREVENLSKIKI